MNKNDSWIETWTGLRLNPLNPEAENLALADIAHSLAMQCRFNGHCRSFYSVAEHSVHVAELLIQDGEIPVVALFGLLHDATEAYLCDIPRPLKAHFPGYLDWEKQLATIIFAKFADRLPDTVENHTVMRADNRLLALEAAELTSSGGHDWSLTEKIPEGIRLACWSPARAESEFLAAYDQVLD